MTTFMTTTMLAEVPNRGNGDVTGTSSIQQDHSSRLLEAFTNRDCWCGSGILFVRLQIAIRPTNPSWIFSLKIFAPNISFLPHRLDQNLGVLGDVSPGPLIGGNFALQPQVSGELPDLSNERPGVGPKDQADKMTNTDNSCFWWG